MVAGKGTSATLQSLMRGKATDGETTEAVEWNMGVKLKYP
jgi:hypothetical protein